MTDDIVLRIGEALAAHGLIPRGGFVFGNDEPAPARTVLLVGNAGADYWPHFSRWREGQPAGLADPLDTWSRKVLGDIASRFAARAVSPSDRPFAPFQQWAMRAEGLRASPLGILMHPRYGLWHAFRGALLFDREIVLPPVASVRHPCETCADRPCLRACPVEAFSPSGFAYEACRAHVRGPKGAACREGGCLARNACPVGADHRYPADVQAFHQAAFVSSA
jgi:hypothetical protein